MAIKKNQIETVKALLEGGADMNATAKVRLSSVHYEN
jgi:ankyrin repeat protein